MAKRYTVTSEMVQDHGGAPVQVIADDDRDALDRAARRAHGRHAQWRPGQLTTSDRSEVGATVYRGGVWIETPMASEARRATEDARWTVTIGWTATAPEVSA